MLQTAAILMGGWLILYAFRRWLANTDNFAGWFFYFDPGRHVYIGEGETIRIAALPEIPKSRRRAHCRCSSSRSTTASPSPCLTA